jgi:hypothetical protein
MVLFCVMCVMSVVPLPLGKNPFAATKTTATTAAASATTTTTTTTTTLIMLPCFRCIYKSVDASYIKLCNALNDMFHFAVFQLYKQVCGAIFLPEV